MGDNKIENKAALADERLAKIDGSNRLETLLEILNEQPDRYIPIDEIREKFKSKYSSQIDQVALDNSLTNLSLSVEGLPELPPSNKRGLPDRLTPQNVEYLAHIAEIRQTKLMDRMRLKLNKNGKTEEKDCYMITIKGIETLNQLRLNRNIVKFNESNDRLSYSIVILTLFLVILAVIQLLYQLISIPKPIMISALILIIVGVLAIERNLLFPRKTNVERRPASKLKQVVVISLFVLFFSLIIIAGTKIFNWSDLAAQTTVTGLFGAYGFYVLEKYVLDVLPIKSRIFKYIASVFVLLVFLFVLIFSLALIQTAASTLGNLAGVQFTPISQNILYEDIGGVVGSWAMYLITVLLGLKKSDGSATS